MKSFVKDCVLDIKREWISIIVWATIVIVFSFFLGAVINGAKTAREAFSISTVMTIFKIGLCAVGIIGILLLILIAVVVIQETLRRMFERIV